MSDHELERRLSRIGIDSQADLGALKTRLLRSIDKASSATPARRLSLRPLLALAAVALLAVLWSLRGGDTGDFTLPKDGATRQAADEDEDAAPLQHGYRAVLLGTPAFRVEAPVNCMDVSADGALAALGCDNGAIVLLDLKTGKTLARQQCFDGAVNTVQWVDGGKQIGACSQEQMALLAVENKKRLRLAQKPLAIADPAFQFGFPRMAAQYAFSSDGGRMYACGSDWTPRVYNSVTGGEAQKFPALEQGSITLALAPDETMLALAADQVHLFDVDAGTYTRSLKNSMNVYALCFSGDSKFILGGGYGVSLCYWDAETGETIHTFQYEHDDVLTAAVSPDGKLGASAHYSGTVRLWNLVDGSLAHEFAGKGRAIAFLNDSELAVCVAQSIEIIDCKKGSVLRGPGATGHTSPVVCMAFSPDGTTLASAADNVIIWDFDKNSAEQLPHTALYAALQFNLDSTALYAAFHREVAWTGEQGVAVFDLATPGKPRTFSVHRRDETKEEAAPARLNLALFNPDAAEAVILCNESYFIEVYDWQSGSYSGGYEVGADRAFIGAYLPQRKQVALLDEQGAVYFFERAAMTEIEGFTVKLDKPLLFGYDSKQDALLAAADKTISRWFVPNGRNRRAEASEVVLEWDKKIVAAAQAPGNDRIVFLDETGCIVLLDPERPDDAKTFANPASAGTAPKHAVLAVNTDATRIAVANADNTITLFVKE